MKKSELRVAVQEMDTYQFGLKNELHNKLTKVTSYVPKKEVIELIGQLEEPEPEPEQEKMVVPQFVADWIDFLRTEHKLSNLRILRELVSYDYTLPNEKARVWALENETTFVEALYNGLEVEKQTYRFTLNAYHEIDVEAKSYEEAEEKAQENWDKTFGNLGTFGGVEFDGEVAE